MTQNLPEIRNNVDLAKMNTLGIHAEADTFIEIYERSQLSEVAKQGIFNQGNFFVLGGGSNILLKDVLSFPVIKMSIQGIEERKISEEEILIDAGAGVVWHELVSYCSQKGYGGIENLALIPGTVGAAPIQNIGAYGVELKDVFESLEMYEISSDSFRIMKKDECEFGYRDSIFKNSLKGKVVVTQVTLRLKLKKYSSDISYRSLKSYLDNKNIPNPSIMDVFNAVTDIRNSKLPNPHELPNAGSFFKNPIIDKEILKLIQGRYPDVPYYPAENDQVKVPAGWLIEKSGWKGKRVGNTGTYENQALVIVNYGGATSREILEFAEKVILSVKENFNVALEPEVNVIG